jgi:D-amino peptidase
MSVNIYIITDLEGISGIDAESQVSDTESAGYAFSIERLMLDTNAAITGAYDGGASHVYVCDGHAGGKNFDVKKLDKRASLVRLSRAELDFNKIDAFMHVGAHAMAGTHNAFYDHTQSSLTWHDYYVNGRKCGELAQGAIFAGVFDAPYVMVSGDAAACFEARQFFGDIECAIVKYADGRNTAHSIDLDAALVNIHDAAMRGVKLVNKIKPFKPTFPLEIKVEFNRSDYCDSAAQRPGNERIDARTIRKTLTEINEYGDIMV